MKLQDFQSLKCSYPAHIPFSTHWSEDDCVAVATGKGVYITDILPSRSMRPPTLNIRRYFVPCSTAFPTKDCGIHFEELMKELNQKGVFQVIQDSTLSPQISKTSTILPSVKQIAWSPAIMDSISRCWLAVLTDSGFLSIYILWRDTWTLGAVVSELWYKHCSSLWTEKPFDVDEMLKELKTRCYKVKFTAFAWGNSRRKLSFDFFAGSLDGTLSLWSIHQDIHTRKLEVQLSFDFSTQRQHITALFSLYFPPNKYILFLCFIDGIITSMVLEYKDDNDVKISPENLIWDENDRLQVYQGGLNAKITITKNIDQNITLIAVKGSYILICIVNGEGKLLSYEIIHSQELNLTGMASLSETKMLMTGFSGAVYLLDTSNAIPSLSKWQDSLRTNHYGCNGLALSKNKTIALLPYSVKANFDHLTLKDLCLLTFCSLQDIPETVEMIIKHRGPLSEIWDVLEHLRIESILKGSSIEWNRTPEELDTMENDELKKNLALLQLSILLDGIKKDNSSADKVNLVKEIQDLILSCHVFRRISCLITDASLSSFDRKCLTTMKIWLDYVLGKYSSKYRHTATTAATLRDQLGSQDSDIIELCSLCDNEMIGFTGSHTCECKLGHQIPRCSLSLVQCAEFPYYYCFTCNVIAHLEAVKSSNPTCIFCDNQLKFTEAILRDEEVLRITGVPENPSYKQCSR